MKITTNNNREKLLAIITMVTLSGTFLFTMVVEPQLIKRKTSLTQLRGLQLEAVRMKANLLIKDRIEKRHSQISTLIHGPGTDQQEISLFSRELNDLYSRLPIKIRTVKLLPLAQEQHYRKLSIKTEMTGNIKYIAQFIRAIETYQKPIKIEQLDIKAKEIKGDVQAVFLLTKAVSNETPLRITNEVN